MFFLGRSFLFIMFSIAMILSHSGAHKKLISSPAVAVFPHPLASDLNFGRFVIITRLTFSFFAYLMI